MEIIIIGSVGMLLDFLLADPLWMPHPVVYIGKAIAWLEKILRRVFPNTNQGQLIAGGIMTGLVAGGTLLISLAVLALCKAIHPLLWWLVNVLWCWQCLAARGLGKAAKQVYEALTTCTIEQARIAVSHIVGRDTKQLTAQQVTKATVETVAENFSDGVIAPLFYFILGGVPAALCYKAINTMDSMVGYQNDRYLYFGRIAAKLDDIANLIPARIAALLLIVTARVAGLHSKEAWRIWRRDRFQHKSPNSAQTEAAMAGALGVQLAGDACYFGKRYQKPTIGDDTRPIEPKDIVRANRLLYTASIVGWIVFATIRFLFLI